jgi:hypothetical protein
MNKTYNQTDSADTQFLVSLNFEKKKIPILYVTTVVECEILFMIFN